MDINYEEIWAKLAAWENAPSHIQQAKILLDDPTAQAISWLKAYVDQLNEKIARQDPRYYDNTLLSVKELIQYALSHKEKGWGDYIVRGGAFEGFSPDPAMYDKLTIITGVDFSDHPHFFSCSC